MPHGMVAVGPNNVSQGWDWCSGYHDSDTTVAGFAQNHLSGTGIADLGEIVVMPFTGEPKLEKGTGNGDGYAVRFDKAHETVVPGYYSVMLDAADIFAEVTATERTAFHRYTYFSEQEGVQTPPDAFSSILNRPPSRFRARAVSSRASKFSMTVP